MREGRWEGREAGDELDVVGLVSRCVTVERLGGARTVVRRDSRAGTAVLFDERAGPVPVMMADRYPASVTKEVRERC